jgi:hypothetical protein
MDHTDRLPCLTSRFEAQTAQKPIEPSSSTAACKGVPSVRTSLEVDDIYPTSLRYAVRERRSWRCIS